MLVPVMALFINASFAPIMMLMPKRMLDLGAGAQGFALMEGLITAGMVVGGALVAWLGARFRPAAGVSLGLFGVSVVMAGFALTGTFLPILALSVGMGLGLAATNTGFGVLLPRLVEPEFRGRVFGLLGMVGQIGMPLTLLALAPFADRLPLPVIFSVASVVTALAALVWTVGGRERSAPSVGAAAD
jgi:DHA3 family macrolide efflux protein-like MFS transporter